MQKKSKETHKKSKSPILQCKFGSEMTKNTPKNGSLNRDLLIFFIGIVYFRCLNESSCPGSSEYVWQRGVEGISGRVTSRRSLPYFPKKEKLICGVQKKCISQNIQN